MYDTKVIKYCGLKQTNGDLGIEVEVETKHPVDCYNAFAPAWRCEEDNSLKGYGTEFVLSTPCEYADVKKLMYHFRKTIKANDIEVLKTIRAGVHIHLNMQQATIRQVINLMCIFYAMETALTRFCGDGREGNLFCMRARDADYAIHRLEQAIAKKDFQMMRDQNLRYAACNVQSLFTFGTVEFRALGTNPDMKNIPQWINILHALKEYAMNAECVADDLTHISAAGGRDWMRKIVGDDNMALLDYPDLEVDILQDVRNIQHLCYTLKEEQ